MTTSGQIIRGTKATYRLVTLLAMGGMAEIWLARQEGGRALGKLVVVKRILPYLAREKKFVEMFIDEARITAQFEHPNIVRIHEVGRTGDTFFFVMEYLEGESLGYLVNAAIMKGRHPPAELTAGIMAQVCDGLDYAHRLQDAEGKPLNIVHRDVSPPNILVLFSGSVKLVDFGIAKADIKLHKTVTGIMKGKVSYMSPEQCRGKPLDGRSDVFSLGIVFWEVLTRRHLFKRDNEMKTLQAIANAQVPPVRRFNQDVDPELDRIVLHALEKDPASRFSTAGEMAAAIREYLQKKGLSAGRREIHAFYNLVLAGHMKTKRALIRKLELSDLSDESLALLKPNIGAGLPEFGPVGEAEDTDVYKHPTRVAPPDLAEARPGYPEEEEPDELDIPTQRLKALDQGHGDLEEATDVVKADATTQPTHPSGVDQEPEDDPEVATVVLAKEPEPEPLEEKEVERTTTEVPVAELASKATPVAEPPAVALVEASLPEEMVVTQPRTRPDVAPRAKKKKALFLLFGIFLGAAVVAGILWWPAGDEPARPPEEAAENDVTKVSEPPAEETPVLNPAMEEESLTAAVPTETEAAPRSPPKPKPRLHKQRRRPVQPSKPGSLQVNTDPWTEVYLGKEKLGITPLLDHKLPAGKHSITLVNERQGIRETIVVQIKPGETASVVKRFNK